MRSRVSEERTVRKVEEMLQAKPLPGPILGSMRGAVSVRMPLSSLVRQKRPRRLPEVRSLQRGISQDYTDCHAKRNQADTLAIRDFC